MRGIWTAACLIGAAICLLLVAFFLLPAFGAGNDPARFAGPLTWAFTFACGAAACIVGLFRSRADIERDTQDDPGPPAPWIEEMRARQDRDAE